MIPPALAARFGKALKLLYEMPHPLRLVKKIRVLVLFRKLKREAPYLIFFSSSNWIATLFTLIGYLEDQGSRALLVAFPHQEPLMKKMKLHMGSDWIPSSMALDLKCAKPILHHSRGGIERWERISEPQTAGVFRQIAVYLDGYLNTVLDAEFVSQRLEQVHNRLISEVFCFGFVPSQVKQSFDPNTHLHVVSPRHIERFIRTNWVQTSGNVLNLIEDRKDNRVDVLFIFRPYGSRTFHQGKFADPGLQLEQTESLSRNLRRVRHYAGNNGRVLFRFDYRDSQYSTKIFLRLSEQFEIEKWPKNELKEVTVEPALISLSRSRYYSVIPYVMDSSVAFFILGLDLFPRVVVGFWPSDLLQKSPGTKAYMSKVNQTLNKLRQAFPSHRYEQLEENLWVVAKSFHPDEPSENVTLRT